MHPSKRPSSLSSCIKKSKFAPKNPVKIETSSLNRLGKPSDVKSDAPKNSNSFRMKSLSKLGVVKSTFNTNTPTDSKVNMKKCQCVDPESIEKDDGDLVCGNCGMVLGRQQIVNTVGFEDGEDGSSRLLGRIVGSDGWFVDFKYLNFCCFLYVSCFSI